jgi:tetratricopeptide (TPR) repeat protein
MSFDPKIVPFDRGADFVHQRALKNRRDNNVIDALELMRKAVEVSPENEGYKMDLAELLTELGCLTQSNQVLLDMLTKGERKDECLYSLAINQLNMNNPDTAKKLLRLCIEDSTNGEIRDQARALSGEIEMYEALNRPLSRRVERMLIISDMACDKLRREDYTGARLLFERAIRMDKSQRDVRALLAMTYMLIGQTDEAIQSAEEAIREPGATLRALCVSGQVFNMAGDEARAREALLRAMEFAPDGLEMRMLIFSLFELKMYGEARDCAAEALKDAPYDRLLLHVMAVTSIRAGESQEKAVRFWQRIARIDPEDTVAAYYCRAAEENKLDPEELSCEYQVPRAEMLERFKYVTDKLDGDIAQLGEDWKADAHFRAMLAWCLAASDRRFREAAVTLLSSIDDPQAESQLREYMLRVDTGFDMTLRAATMYRMRGLDVRKILPPYMRKSEGLMPDGNRVLDAMSVGHRQLVRLASDVLERQYDVYAFDHLAVMWDMYRRHTPMRTDPLVKTETAAAALSYCYLALAEKKPSFYRLSAQFGCPVRQLMYFARRMAAVLERGGSTNGETD